MHILVIFIKNWGYVHTNNNHDGFIDYNNFSNGIVFLILVFPLKVTTGLNAWSGTRVHPLYSWVEYL
jgi:hypothetical protein